MTPTTVGSTSRTTPPDIREREARRSATAGSSGSSAPRTKGAKVPSARPLCRRGERVDLGGRQHANVGLLSFSDPNLAPSYIFVIGGLLLAGLAITLRRRNPAAAQGDRDADRR